MTVASESKKRKPRKRAANGGKNGGGGWWIVLPLLVGALVTPATIHLASILALSGTDALTLLYPWVQLVKSPALRVPGEIANPLAQYLLYLQFPAYGVVMMWMLGRKRSLAGALMAVVFLHALAFAGAYGLGYLQGGSFHFNL
jgi:hypothetical protein